MTDAMTATLASTESIRTKHHARVRMERHMGVLAGVNIVARGGETIELAEDDGIIKHRSPAFHGQWVETDADSLDTDLDWLAT